MMDAMPLRRQRRRREPRLKQKENVWRRVSSKTSTIEMQYDPHRHHRRSIRLKDYDYSQQGGYFVTMCVRDHECLFGKIVDGEMELNKLGNIVKGEWLRTTEIRPNVELDEFVVMPNHVHGIIILHDDELCRGLLQYAPTTGYVPRMQHAHAERKSPSQNLGAIVRGFKSATTKQINEMRNAPGASLWQRNYYESIIRNEKEMATIRTYIFNNPRNWMMNKENDS